jgi:hypothetical protein
MTEEIRRCPEYRCLLREGHVGDHQTSFVHGRDSEIACRGKRRYGTEAQAQTVAARCYEARQHWLRVYYCADCGGYHLTHRDAKPKPGWREPAPSKRETSERRRREQRDRRRKNRYDDE